MPRIDRSKRFLTRVVQSRWEGYMMRWYILLLQLRSCNFDYVSLLTIFMNM